MTHRRRLIVPRSNATDAENHGVEKKKESVPTSKEPEVGSEIQKECRSVLNSGAHRRQNHSKSTTDTTDRRVSREVQITPQ